jgi:flavin-dependent dehydrogenase
MTAERQASEVELVSLQVAKDRYDVAILGGGLAGLTLAIQLKRQRPSTSVAVLEKREGPAPDAAFKVGESTVPSGAHYFAEVVGLRDHLEEAHIVKNGLRFFMPAQGNVDITKRIEAGAPVYPPHDNYQIDRGRFENELASRARGLGVEFLQGCRAGEVSFGSDEHSVAFTQMGMQRSLGARWVVDAAGRASLLKRQLGLAKEVSHTINSAWLRLAGGLDIEDWGEHDPDWLAKMAKPRTRQFSTNHLLGEGYWVWLIPLGTGPISIGVCADPRFHPFEEINELGPFIDFMSRHEPQLEASLKPRLGDVQDFLRVEDFAFGVERVFSPERWCLVGEAAAFADPFYSPGSDMIGYGNVFTADLIGRDLEGEDVSERLEFFNDYYLRTFAHVLARTEDHYATFGNPTVMFPKQTYDGIVQHVGTVLLFIKNKLTDLEFMKSVNDDVDRIYRLNIRTQQLFREWLAHEERPFDDDPPKLPAGFPLLIEGFVGLVKDYTDDELRAAIRRHVEILEALAVVLFHKAASGLPEPPDKQRRINPYAVSLNPDEWEADGLFDDDGWALVDALEVSAGYEQCWLDGVSVAA